MTVYKTEVTVRRKRKAPQIRSLSTLWLIAVVAIIFVTGALVNLV